MKNNSFLFFSSVSKNYQQIKSSYKIPDFENTTIMYLENDNTYIKSTAVLKIIRRLRGGWPIAYLFILVPKKIRDMVYSYIARKRKSCNI